MATTFLRAHHISPGRTILQSLSDLFDHGKNPKKTLDGALIGAHEYDLPTADVEFLLSKARYQAITGRWAEAGHFYPEDIRTLQKDYADLWGPLSNLLKQLTEVVKM